MRICCLMMQKDEEVLLRPWLLHHGYLFGFENLYIYDNGSTSAVVLETLREFAALGVNVDFTHAASQDSDLRDEIIGGTIAGLRDADACDIALPLDCDEFLAIRGRDGISCQRTEILKEIDGILRAEQNCRIDHCLENWPGQLDLFRYVEHTASVIAVRHFRDAGHDFQRSDPPAGPSCGKTDLIHLHFPFKPFDQLPASIRDRLGHPPAEGSGTGGQLRPLSPDDYYAGPSGYHHPLVRFRGLMRLLEASREASRLRSAWNGARGAAHPVALPEIDLDAQPFRPAEYRAANPGLPGGDFDLFGHFVVAGYHEGRQLSPTPEAMQEVVRRLTLLRSIVHDGEAGYFGLVHALANVGRSAEGEEVIARGIAEFGQTPSLLREHALSAMYLDDYVEAMRRWEIFLGAFPDRSEGYVYASLAGLKAGRFDAAWLVAEQGLERFPGDVSLLMRLIEVSIERNDWDRVKAQWEALQQAAPDHPEVRASTGWISFRLREWQAYQDENTEVVAMDGPVVVQMSEEETRLALAFLDLPDVQALRKFFMQFESLGHSCEFGLVQRHYGAEPISLLRWNSINTQKLQQALEEDFAAIDDPGQIRCEVIRGEYIVRDLTYHTAMHSFVHEGTIEARKFLTQQIKRLKFLRRKLLSDLGSDDKIFVHLENSEQPKDGIEALGRAFHRHGDGRLLYVRVAGAQQRPGTVEPGGEGVLIGYTARPGRNSVGEWHIDFDSWISLCRAAALYWDFQRTARQA